MLVEVNAFTNPELFESRVLKTLIAEILADKGETGLITKYAIEGFSINVLSVRRNLVEKMLGVIKDSYNEDPVTKLPDQIRHLYDL